MENIRKYRHDCDGCNQHDIVLEDLRRLPKEVEYAMDSYIIHWNLKHRFKKNNNYTLTFEWEPLKIS